MRSIIVMCPCSIVNDQVLALLCRCFSVSCSALLFSRSSLSPSLSPTLDRMPLHGAAITNCGRERKYVFREYDCRQNVRDKMHPSRVANDRYLVNIVAQANPLSSFALSPLWLSILFGSWYHDPDVGRISAAR